MKDLRKRKRLIQGGGGRLLCLFCLVVLCSCQQPAPQQQWLRALSKQIQQGYGSLAAAGKGLEQATAHYCESAGELAELQRHWRQTMAAWQRIQWVNFGPIMLDNDHWKLQFWPDKKNLVSRKVSAFIQAEGAITQDRLQEASVAIQGLSALELLLFDQSFFNQRESSSRQCQFVLVLASNVSQIGQRLAIAWQQPEFIENWLAKDNGLANEATVVEALLTHLEAIKLDKLGEPLGYKSRKKRANGYFAESWRSETSLANIQANLVAVQQLTMPAEGYGLQHYLLDKGHEPLARQLSDQLKDLLNQAEAIQLPLRTAVEDDAAKSQVIQLYNGLASLNHLLKQQLAPALGISLGFNANDGD